MAFSLQNFQTGISSFSGAASSFGSAAVAGASAAAEDLLAQGSQMQRQANLVERDAYTASAKLAEQNRGIVQENTAIQYATNAIQAQQAKREAYMSGGATRADAAGAGLKTSGSATDVLRQTASQGEVTQQLYNLQGGVIKAQGALDVSSIDQQIASYNTQATVADYAAQEADISSQAHLANAAGLRTSKTTSTVGGVLGVIGGIASIFGCWVAREVYGERNPRWLEFRHWLVNDAPRWFYRLYMAHGEAFAGWLRKHPWAKRYVRAAMELTLLMAHQPPGEWAHA